MVDPRLAPGDQEAVMAGAKLEGARVSHVFTDEAAALQDSVVSEWVDVDPSTCTPVVIRYGKSHSQHSRSNQDQNEEANP